MAEKPKKNHVKTKYIKLNKEILLDSGKKLKDIEIAYETYGSLNKKKNNSILIFHALSGDAHVAGYHKGDKKPGWWNNYVGEGKAIDTSKYFIICANVIGGCKGTTGPLSYMPKTKKRYGMDFPVITIKDMVKVQKAMLEQMKIEKLFAVIGGSMGGMLTLQFGVDYPDASEIVMPIATASKQPVQAIAFHEVGRQAIMGDPKWRKGNYYNSKSKPTEGLAAARMLAHITYLSEKALRNKFGRKLQDKERISFSFNTDFQIESYLKYQGKNFIERFDANSYLFITRAIDYFDLGTPKQLPNKFTNKRQEYLVLSVSSDWLYPTSESKIIVEALRKSGISTTFYEMKSNAGHDGFLLKDKHLENVIGNFLDKRFEGE